MNRKGLSMPHTFIFEQKQEKKMEDVCFKCGCISYISILLFHITCEVHIYIQNV